MTLRELLDDTILRLGLCDRVDLLAVRKFFDGIEAQRASMAKQGLADQLEPTGPAMKRYFDAEADAAVRRSAVADFAPERHLTPAGGPAPYESLEIVREGGAG